MDDTDGTYAWSFKSGVDIVDEYAGVAVNDQYVKDYDSFISNKQNDLLEKWAPIGCGTPKSVTDHELGHEIDKLLNASSDLEIREMYSEMMQAGNARDVLSQYSATNVKEFIAESYSEFRNNPSPREVSTRVYNRLIELRDQKVYRKGLVR